MGGAHLEDARRAHLHWVTDAGPGLSRRRRGSAFSYMKDGAPVHDRQTIDRIRALAIPPAWTDVWICPDPDGHIQATGRDARKRKQYRYHDRWREVRDSNKYDRTVSFGEALPRIRKRVESDLRLRGLVRNRVLAAIVRLLDLTLIRVGNAEYAEDNKSYGLTTLRSSSRRRRRRRDPPELSRQGREACHRRSAGPPRRHDHAARHDATGGGTLPVRR